MAVVQSRGGTSVPMRMCRVCRKRCPQSELTRWIMQANQLTPDPSRRLGGRGTYSCSEACSDKLKSSSASIKRKR